jgi:predicted nucleic acid-binding protein
LLPLVLDTDVASLRFKGELPAAMHARLTGREPLITFVTLAEMTKWADLRRWGARRRRELTEWLAGVAVLPGTEDVSVTCGHISASAMLRGRPRPANDTWIAACCLTYDLPLATFNVKDFEDFAEYEDLTLITR